MLIYAAADIHGYHRRIRRLTSQVAAHRPDILLLAGDISRRLQPEVTLDGLNRLGLPDAAAASMNPLISNQSFNIRARVNLL